MTNARSNRGADRAEKLAQLRRQQATAERRRNAGIAAGVVVAVAVVAAAVFAAVRNDAGGGAGATLSGVQSFTKERSHVTGKVVYPQTPPAGGNHSSVLLNCGIYRAPVPNENAVHDLEHGAVWITYRPDLGTAAVATLTGFAQGQTYLDLSPYPGLPAPVVVSAWGQQLRLTGAEDPRLATFVKKYRQGPQTLEPGASCTGGIGTPDG